MQRKVFIAMTVLCVLWLLISMTYLCNDVVNSMKLFALERKRVDQWSNDTKDEKTSVSPSPGDVSNDTKTLPGLAPCPETSPHLVGPLAVEFNQPLTLDSVRKDNADLQDGGRFKPHDCIARQKVAIIVPFRNRSHHLKYWLYYLHPILQRQQLDYGIYITNQHGNGVFNRAKLMNVGFVEALNEYDYDCFIFSDVDLVPMDDRNTYRCFSQPRHLSVAVDKFGFRLPYNNIFGGVTALSKEQFLKINGFPNRYWGWGGEDDEMYTRTSLHGMSLSRPDQQVGRYKMFKHTRDLHNEPNQRRFDLLAGTRVNMDKDGINSLQYSVVKTEKDKLFTFITVDIGSPA